MTVQVFTVYDSKVGAYLAPFYMRSTGEAVRAFADSCDDPKHMFAMHPADYTLFRLGSFDEPSGSFELNGAPTAVCTALEMLTKVDE